MANTISNAFVKQYGSAVHMNAEINGGKFAGKVREESITGEAAFYETLDSVFADAAGAQFSDSPNGEVAHDRRMLTPVDLEVGLMIDNWDKVKTLANFEGHYVKRMVEALMRKKDIQVITGALGSAQTGKTGSTTTTFDYTNQVVAVTVGGGGGNAGLNLAKLKEAKAKFWKNGVNIEDPNKKLYLVCAGKQIENLLNDDEAINADYNSVRALVNGDINSYMGFEIIRSELVPYVNAGTVELSWDASDVPEDTAGTEIRGCFAYSKDSLLCATNPDIFTKIAERSDKRFNWYAYAALGTATVRMEEKGVVLIPCDETV